MINALIGFGLAVSISLLLTAIFGTVTTLPWGLDEALLIFMVQVNMIISVLPPFATIWHVFIIALMVKMALFVFEKTLWLLSFIRGGG